jgi:hypothetical protein
VVTADYKGYLHWLDKATGGLAARERTGKVRVSNPPLVAGNMVIVINDAGKINAYRTTPTGSAMKGPHKVPEETAPAGAPPATTPTEPATPPPVSPQ